MTVSYGRPSASAPRLRGGLPGADEGGPFEHPSYVRASAEHEGTEPVVLHFTRVFVTSPSPVGSTAMPGPPRPLSQ